MQLRRQAELHRHGVGASESALSGFSLLRLSVPARLLIVALATAMLWSAVLWALH
jgi:hypothetical protein